METRQDLKRKIREGVVISNKMDKTVVVRVDRTLRHPSLQKVIVRGKKYYVHNENKELTVGTKVRIVETKPLSKLKRWRILEKIA
jgi:small subunit ribosomal protein S17